MEMPGRTGMMDRYRFGFNGKENDREWGTAGLTQDYGMRLYNPAVGRFLSVDPLFSSYPWYTPYQFAGNTPIQAIDLDGLEEWYTNDGAKSDQSGPLSDESRMNQGLYSKEELKNQDFVNNNEARRRSQFIEEAQGILSEVGKDVLEGIDVTNTSSSTSGVNGYLLFNSSLRLYYSQAAQKLQPLYHKFGISPHMAKGAVARANLLNRVRDFMIGGRSHVDLVKPVKVGFLKPDGSNARFFKTDMRVTGFAAGSMLFSIYQLGTSGSELSNKYAMGDIEGYYRQLAIEGGKWSGGYIGMRMGVWISTKSGVRHPILALGIVGLAGAAGSLIGSEGMEAMMSSMGVDEMTLYEIPDKYKIRRTDGRNRSGRLRNRGPRR